MDLEMLTSWLEASPREGLNCNLRPRHGPERIMNYGLIYERILMKMGKINFLRR